MIDSPKQPKSSAVNVGAMQVANVYAKAFLGAAETKGQTDVAMEELNAVGDTLAQYPKLEAVFGSALIDARREVRRFSTACSSPGSRRWCSIFSRSWHATAGSTSCRPFSNKLRHCSTSCAAGCA